jgi:putative ABC transport system permease protein
MPVAFGVSVLVGVIFGVVPARKAAHMSALAALRYE